MHVVAGPTASGKTALAIELARWLGAEIVSADSQQVYRHFDVGTAKPSPEQLRAVPHHLISVVDPLEPFSAARYQALADHALADLGSRGKPVVVVGGTGLYLRVLLHGVVAAPGADAQLRGELEQLPSQSLHDRLAAVDPVTASRLPSADRVRVIRALEIHAVSGRPASEARAAHGFEADRYPYRLWVLAPPRDTLYAAINQRTRQMFAAGLVEETRSLIDRGFRPAAAMGSVGYAQALQVIDGAMSVEQAIDDTAQKTRHYAKRQLTWFRKEKGARFLEPPFTVEGLLGSP